MTYQLTSSTGIIRISDGAYIPDDSLNQDWQLYQAWVADGNSAITANIFNQLPSQAQTALTESDKTIIRCYENSVVVPSAWTTYRKALRSIVNGSDTASTSLPAIPSYPTGT